LASEKSGIDKLEDSFSPKLLFLAFRKNIESLLEMLLGGGATVGVRQGNI
jgi:hypothetical protein